MDESSDCWTDRRTDQQTGRPANRNAHLKNPLPSCCLFPLPSERSLLPSVPTTLILPFGQRREWWHIGCVYNGMENHDISAVFNSMFLVVPPSCLWGPSSCLWGRPSCLTDPPSYLSDPPDGLTGPSRSFIHYPPLTMVKHAFEKRVNFMIPIHSKHTLIW